MESTMKIWSVLISALLGLMVISASSFAGDVYVQGYFKKNGTYVAPHYRSSPNSTQQDNWSTRGNVKPKHLERGLRVTYC
jgi:hypothetical protein